MLSEGRTLEVLVDWNFWGSYRISADEVRRKLGVETVRLDIEIPEGLEKRILEYRHKRVY
ncbi:MAG: hypothetical protein ACP5GU_04635 [Thermoprotei archaeon]|jgi:hypothetical protein